MIVALVLLVALALGADVPAVPQNDAHIDAFVANHGTPLLEDFARHSMASKVGRAAHAISDDAVQSTASQMLTRLHTKSAPEKVRYLTGMQKKLGVLKAGNW